MQPGFLSAPMMAQRRDVVTMQMRRQRMMMLMQQQQQQAAAAAAAAGGFSPPPNVTAPGGMDSHMGGPNMGQPGPQQFGYGGSYGESTEPVGRRDTTPPPWWWGQAEQGSSFKSVMFKKRLFLVFYFGKQ